MSKEYNTKIIRYPDSVEIIKYGESRTRGAPVSRRLKPLDEEDSKEDEAQRTLAQAYRIKRKVKHYAIANDFNLFWTLTFDDAKVNASDYTYSRKRLSAWLKYQREKYGRFGYLFFPELHPTSGRIHFHGLTENFSPPLVEARNAKTNRLIRKNGVQVYNAPTWKNGFSTVSEINDKAKTASYISKYITKELIEIPTAYNQPRYFVSRGLKLPEITYETWGTEQLQEFTPSFVVGDMSSETGGFKPKVSIYHLNVSEEQFTQSTPPETVYKLTNYANKQIANEPPTAYIDNLSNVDN
ncbi:MAG: hypothetical protein ACLVO2_12745 [Clostridia bacterium]